MSNSKKEPEMLPDDSPVKEFSRRLEELRQSLNMNRQEFAQKVVGTSRQSAGYYLDGWRFPDGDTIRNICQKGHVSADWLLGLSDVKEPDAEIKGICEKTGLSEKAVDFLIDGRYIDSPVISEILENEWIHLVLSEYHVYNGIRPVFVPPIEAYTGGIVTLNPCDSARYHIEQCAKKFGYLLDSIYDRKWSKIVTQQLEWLKNPDAEGKEQDTDLA